MATKSTLDKGHLTKCYWVYMYIYIFEPVCILMTLYGVKEIDNTYNNSNSSKQSLKLSNYHNICPHDEFM